MSHFLPFVAPAGIPRILNFCSDACHGSQCPIFCPSWPVLAYPEFLIFSVMLTIQGFIMFFLITILHVDMHTLIPADAFHATHSTTAPLHSYTASCAPQLTCFFFGPCDKQGHTLGKHCCCYITRGGGGYGKKIAQKFFPTPKRDISLSLRHVFGFGRCKEGIFQSNHGYFSQDGCYLCLRAQRPPVCSGCSVAPHLGLLSAGKSPQIRQYTLSGARNRTSSIEGQG